MRGQYWTRSGLDVDPLALSIDEVLLEDIAHHLAIINRYNGASSKPYSVAQHSVKCAQLAEAAKLGPLVAMGALLHDAQEAYLGDVVKPIKSRVFTVPGDHTYHGEGATFEWSEIEGRTLGVVCLGLGILPKDTVCLPEVHEIDRVILSYEMKALGFPEEAIPTPPRPTWFHNGLEIRIRPWGWEMAREAFIASFESLRKAYSEEMKNRRMR